MISIGKIANHRDLGDVSGTLSVELWALDRPYSGGSFEGVPLAGTSIGELRGQHFLPECRYDLVFQQPPAGTWYLTLMLREWTAVGYMTRDFVNFALPYVVESRPVVRGESGNVISVEFAGSKQRPSAPAETEAKTRPANAAPAKASTPAPKEPKPKPGTSLNTAAAPARVSVPSRKEKEAEPGPGVSLNSATPREIAAVKGISKKVAENIIAARPYDSVDDLVRVKGMGAKLLARVRSFFRI